MATTRCLRPRKGPYDGTSPTGLAESASAVKLRAGYLCLLERLRDIDAHPLPTASQILVNDDL